MPSILKARNRGDGRTEYAGSITMMALPRGEEQGSLRYPLLMIGGVMIPPGPGKGEAR